MSNLALNWAKTQEAGGLAPKALLLVLADRARVEDGSVWLSRTALAEILECDARTISRALKELEGRKLIVREERHREDGARTSDRIVLNLPPAVAGGDEGVLITPLDKLSRGGATESRPPSTICPPPLDTMSRQETKPKPQEETGDSPTPSAMPALRPGESYLPADWQPDQQDVRAAIEAGLKPENIPHEAAQFRDRMLSRGIASFDWRAAWRSWCRSPYRKGGEADTGQYRRRTPTPTYPRPATSRDLWARAAREAHDNLTRTSDDQQGDFDDESGPAGAGEPGARGHGGPVRERPRGELVRLPAYGDPGRRRAVG